MHKMSEKIMPYSNVQHRSIFLLKMLGVTAFYALSIYIEHYFFKRDAPVSPFEASSGFALAVLLIGGKRYAWSVFLGALLANTMQDTFLEAAAISSSDTLEALCGAWLLTRNAKFDESIRSLHDYLRLILWGGILGVSIGAVVGVTALLVFGFITAANYSHELLHWWMGDMLGVILITPLMLSWQKTNNAHEVPTGQLFEYVLLLGLAFFIGQVVFLDWFHSSVGYVAKGYWMFLLITWIAVRLDVRSVTAVLLVTAVQALFGAYNEVGFFKHDIAETHFANYWFYMATLSIVGMAMAIHLAERKKAEIKLQNSELLFRTLVSTSSQSVWHYRSGGLPIQQIDQASAAWWREFTRQTEEQRTGNGGMGWLAAVHEEDREIARRNWLDISTMGKPSTVNYRVRRWDGDWRWLQVRSVPIRDEQDSITEWAGTITDITDQEKTNLRLRESEERWAFAIEGSGDGVWDWDLLTGKIVFSKRYKEILGFPEEANWDSLGDWKDRVNPEDMGRAMIALESYLDGKLPAYAVEYRMLCGDGGWKWMLARGMVVARAQDGMPMRMIGTHTDITERKRMERQLHELASHLQTVREEEKARIAREIHDDLGGTLTALKMEAYWLADELSVIDKAAPLLKHTELMGQLVDNATSAMRSIITGLRPAMLDDLGLLAAIEWHATQFHKSTGIECQMDCVLDKDDEEKLFGMQSIHLFRILQEALTNVSRHSHASKVAVEMFCSDGKIKLSISDNGRGIPKNHAIASNSYGMLGMNERVEQLGGTIKFGNSPGGGFSVTVNLPLSDNKKEEKELSAS